MPSMSMSMKCLFFVLSLGCLVQSATYYFDSLGGDDSRTASQAQMQATPWKSLTKFNAIQSTLQPGDSALFLRGRRWQGRLDISASGNISQPISIGAYGSTNDALPIFSGAVNVTSAWTKTGSIYSTPFTIPADTQGTITDIFVDGKRMTYARAPNSGWYRLTSDASGSTIVDANRTEASGYWNNAVVRIRTSHYLYDIQTVTSFANGVFNLGGNLNGQPSAGYGYFLEGKSSLLDAPSEWFYDGTTLSIMTPDGTSPAQHLIEAVVYNSSLVISGQASYITISNMRVEKNSDTNIRGTHFLLREFST